MSMKLSSQVAEITCSIISVVNELTNFGKAPAGPGNLRFLLPLPALSGVGVLILDGVLLVPVPNVPPCNVCAALVLPVFSVNIACEDIG